MCPRLTHPILHFIAKSLKNEGFCRLLKRGLAPSLLVLGDLNFKNSHSVETKPLLLKKTYIRNVPLQKVVKTIWFCKVLENLAKLLGFHDFLEG